MVSVVGTVAAAWLAWVAIRRGNAQAKASSDALVRERRIDFELDPGWTRCIHNVMSFAPFTGPTAKHLQLLPDPFPLLRAVMGEKSTPEAEAALREALDRHGYAGGAYTERLPLSSGKSVGEAVREEVEEAIQRRLSERDQPVSSTQAAPRAPTNSPPPEDCDRQHRSHRVVLRVERRPGRLTGATPRSAVRLSNAQVSANDAATPSTSCTLWDGASDLGCPAARRHLRGLQTEDAADHGAAEGVHGDAPTRGHGTRRFLSG